MANPHFSKFHFHFRPYRLGFPLAPRVVLNYKIHKLICAPFLCYSHIDSLSNTHKQSYITFIIVSLYSSQHTPTCEHRAHIQNYPRKWKHRHRRLVIYLFAAPYKALCKQIYCEIFTLNILPHCKMYLC